MSGIMWVIPWNWDFKLKSNIWYFSDGPIAKYVERKISIIAFGWFLREADTQSDSTIYIVGYCKTSQRQHIRSHQRDWCCTVLHSPFTVGRSSKTFVGFVWTCWANEMARNIGISHISIIFMYNTCYWSGT